MPGSGTKAREARKPRKPRAEALASRRARGDVNGPPRSAATKSAIRGDAGVPLAPPVLGGDVSGWATSSVGETLAEPVARCRSAASLNRFKPTQARPVTMTVARRTATTIASITETEPREANEMRRLPAAPQTTDIAHAFCTPGQEICGMPFRRSNSGIPNNGRSSASRFSSSRVAPEPLVVGLAMMVSTRRRPNAARTSPWLNTTNAQIPMGRPIRQAGETMAKMLAVTARPYALSRFIFSEAKIIRPLRNIGMRKIASSIRIAGRTPNLLQLGASPDMPW